MEKQSSIVFNQHHQVHLVSQVVGAANESRCFSPVPLSVSLCCLQKREKKKEEEQRRKEWVDKEREKTLSRLRSFREVRRSHSFCSAFACSSLRVNKTRGDAASYPLNVIVHLKNKSSVISHSTPRVGGSPDDGALWLWTGLLVMSCLTPELQTVRGRLLFVGF